jgi:hypothetical protein
MANKVPNADPSFSLGFTSSCIEGNLAIITASIPALWPLARLWYPSFFARLSGRYSIDRHGARRDAANNDNDKRIVTIGGTSQHHYSDGSSFVMKPVRGYGHTEISRGSEDGSLAGKQTPAGIIVRTTNVDVEFGEGPITRFGPFAKYGKEQD